MKEHPRKAERRIRRTHREPKRIIFSGMKQKTSRLGQRLLLFDPIRSNKRNWEHASSNAQQTVNVQQIKRESSGSWLTKAATQNRLRSITSCDVEFWLAYVVFCGLTCDDPYRSFWFPLGWTPVLMMYRIKFRTPIVTREPLIGKTICWLLWILLPENRLAITWNGWRD